MKQIVKTIVLGAALAAMVTGCADMNRRQRNTAIGAGAGAVLGSVLTNGDAFGTIGGAAVGGVIGHQVR